MTGVQTCALPICFPVTILQIEQALIDFGKEIKQNLVIKSFIKYKVGEGIEVKKTDFNEEVKSLAGA